MFVHVLPRVYGRERCADQARNVCTAMWQNSPQGAVGKMTAGDMTSRTPLLLPMAAYSPLFSCLMGRLPHGLLNGTAPTSSQVLFIGYWSIYEKIALTECNLLLPCALNHPTASTRVGCSKSQQNGWIDRSKQSLTTSVDWNWNKMCTSLLLTISLVRLIRNEYEINS